MAATTTTVTGPIETLGGSALSGKYIRFTLLTSGTETATGDLVAASTTSELLDANGDFSATLWVNGESGVESIYRIEIPGDTLAYDVIIPTSAGGGSISVETLIENHQVAGSIQQSTTLSQATAYTDSELDAFAIDPATAQVNFNAANWTADLGIVTASGGGQVGNFASSTTGGAIGGGSSATTGGAVGDSASSTTGGAVGNGSSATFGGGAVGYLASSTTGGAVGNGSSATFGGAIGGGSSATTGGAVGNFSVAIDGFAGGSNASANGAGRVQLGAGTNSTDSTIQFLSSGSVTAAEFGLLSGAETAASGGITDNDSAVPTSAAVLDLVYAPTTSVTTTTYTLLSSDRTLLCNNASGVTVTLLAAATAGDGFTVTIKNVGSAGSVTIDGNASETIDGGLTAVLTSQYESLTIVCDGSNWNII